MEVIQKYGLGIIVGVLVLFFLAERNFPLRLSRRPLLPRLLVNGILSILTYSTAAFLVRPASMSALSWSTHNQIGVLSWFTLPAWLEACIGFLLLDLSFYYWHRLNHQVSFLWRFHNVHHFDPDLDASTGFRFHFAEVAISTVFRVFQIMIIGVSLQTFILYEFCFQLGTYFHHSNLRLPILVDRSINFFIVTPRMHGIHHSNYHDETDSNFSVVFSIWDRLHRTFHAGIPQSEITIGVPGYLNSSDNRLESVLLAPFRRQRDYWRGQEKRKTSKS